MNSIMNKLRRFIIGTSVIFSLGATVLLPGLANAAAPTAPTIGPATVYHDSAFLVTLTPDLKDGYCTGYTTDGTDPLITVVAATCVPATGTSLYAMPFTLDGVDGTPVEVRAVSTDDSGVAGPISTVTYIFDKIAPIISLNGNDDITIEAREPYNDLGITTFDVNGEVITWQEGNLNTGLVGTYVVTYYAMDVVGNTSSITRTVRVVDTTAPVLNLNGSNDITLEVHSSYIELGATAIDSYDGNITANIVVTGGVDVHHVGVYTLTYTVTDANGNVSVVTRTVRVVDTTNPVLTLNGTTSPTLEVYAPYVEAGYTAVDNYDGDITNQVVVTGTVNTGVVGVYTLTYTITDANGNVTMLTRTINIVDTTDPIITLNGLSTITVEVHTPYTEQGASALDNYDGDIASQIVITGYVDVHTVGVYTLTYTITDANGNTASVTRTVRVVDTTKPVITLIGSADVTLTAGDVYSELGANANDNYDGDISSKIVISGSVDWNTPGKYTVVYTVTDSSGNTNTITRVITVYAKPVVFAPVAFEDNYTTPEVASSIDADEGIATESVKSAGISGNDENVDDSSAQNRNAYIFLLIVLLILSGLGYYLYRKRKQI